MDRIETYFPNRMPLNDALTQVQWALIKLQSQPDYADLGLKLTSVDLNLVTYADITASGEVKILVVTVAGEIAAKSTNTLNVTLQPPKAKAVDALGEEEMTTAETVEALGKAMMSVVSHAMNGNPPLELKEGKITVELVVDAKGSITVATPSILEGVLKLLFGEDLGIEAKVGSNLILTSSIELTFGKG